MATIEVPGKSVLGISSKTGLDMKNCVLGHSDMFDRFSFCSKEEDSIINQHPVDKVLTDSVPPKFSYAQAVSGKTDDLVGPLSCDGVFAAPVLRDDLLVVSIPPVFYKSCIERAEDLDLIGHFQFQKGAKPVTVDDLRSKLRNYWKISDWKLTPIGKGYFYIKFLKKEDKSLVWSTGTVPLFPGSFKLIKWSPNFDPFKQKNSNAEIWVRIFGIGGEIFNKEVIINVAKAIGSPVKVDPSSLNFNLGFFARVLIDVDLSITPPSSIVLSSNGIEVLLRVEYEFLPKYCSSCSSIGHEAADCRRKVEDARGRQGDRQVHYDRFRSQSRYRNKARGPGLVSKPLSKVDKDGFQFVSNKSKFSNVMNKSDVINMVDSDKLVVNTSDKSKNDKSAIVSNQFSVLNNEVLDKNTDKSAVKASDPFIAMSSIKNSLSKDRVTYSENIGDDHNNIIKPIFNESDEFFVSDDAVLSMVSIDLEDPVKDIVIGLNKDFLDKGDDKELGEITPGGSQGRFWQNSLDMNGNNVEEDQVFDSVNAGNKYLLRNLDDKKIQEIKKSVEHSKKPRKYKKQK